MKILVLKSHLGPAGFVHAGDQIDIDINRHRALARTGIVTPPDGEEPPAPVAGVKHGLANADFKARRDRIVEKKPDSKPSQPQASTAATGAKAP